MSLPDTYRTGHEMARTLASYIECPFRVRREVMQLFAKAPNTDEIRAMRRRHLAPRPASEPVRLTDAYYPSQAADALVEANNRFLDALFAAGARP